MTRAAIYLRVSLDATGELLAVDRQREDCMEIVKRKGWELAGEYLDNSVSASKKNVKRPAYESMVADFHDGAFDALVCYDLDRLTRQPRQLEDWIDAATERGLKLVTANGEADLSTDGGRLFARVKAAVAREEVERKGARQKRAALQRVESGLRSSFKPCLGYDSKNNIIEREAAVVREMFSKFAAGESLQGLTRWMQTLDVRPPQSEVWSKTTVRCILANPRYAARNVHKKVVLSTPGGWTPIIEPGLFDSVQAILSDPRRKTNRHGTARKYLLSSIARCGVCGGPMRGTPAAYLCGAACLTRTRSYCDDLVNGVVKARLSELTAADLPKSVSPISDSRVVELRGRLATVEADYDAGLIDGHRFATANEKIKAELLELERSRLGSSGRAATASVLGATDPAEAYDSATLSTRRAIVDALLSVRMLKRTTRNSKFDYDSVELKWKV